MNLAYMLGFALGSVYYLVAFVVTFNDITFFFSFLIVLAGLLFVLAWVLKKVASQFREIIDYWKK